MSFNPLQTRSSKSKVFVPNPYVKGSSLRQDIYDTQFGLLVDGNFEYTQDDPVHGTYLTEGTLLIEEAATITELVNFAQGCDEDYWSTQAFESEANDFYPKCFRIIARNGALVLGAKASSMAIQWIEPEYSLVERESVISKVDELHREACYEGGWDNYTTADNLRQEAKILSFKLTDPVISRSQYYQDEIRQLTQQKQHRNLLMNG